MQWRRFYKNGYGVSVVNNEFSYGLELAVLIGDEDNSEITYDTPVTSDVLGHLTDETLEQAINAVKALPSVKEKE